MYGCAFILYYILSESLCTSKHDHPEPQITVKLRDHTILALSLLKIQITTNPVHIYYSFNVHVDNTTGRRGGVWGGVGARDKKCQNTNVIPPSTYHVQQCITVQLPLIFLIFFLTPIDFFF